MFSFLKSLSTLEKVILFIISIVYIHNLFIDIMNVDAAQYADISNEMAATNSFLEVKEFGNDYLDKPPLLFWLSSLSIKLFGINNFAYKFPSFILLLVSLYAVYRFSKLYYSEKIAKNALFILATTQAYFLITNDVKTDSLLTSCTIISVWLFSEYFENRKLKDLIYASIFMGLGMLSKGPIGAIAVLLPIGANLMYHKKWNDVFTIRWLLVISIVALLLLPMSYGLYTQFDSHPEKQKSGLYFYYWLQSFGRITGESTWNNGLPWHFFIGSITWDFFPWIFPLYIALFIKLKNIFFWDKKLPEISTLVGFIGIFAMMSLSKYKLPHYIFVCLPFASIMVAQYFEELDFKFWKHWKTTYTILGIIILTLFFIFNIFFFKELNLISVAIIFVQLLILFYGRKFKIHTVFGLLILVCTLNLFLSFVFYPKLLSYQSDARAAKWASVSLKNEEVFLYNEPSHLYNFYSKNPFTKVISKNEIVNFKKAIWIFVKEKDLKELKDLKVTVIAKKTFYNYPISRLKLDFLLENKRSNVLEKRHLIKIK
jgi:4-amino-4-deoxy-L-arabinose transferase-like glycosyltransferase